MYAVFQSFSHTFRRRKNCVKTLILQHQKEQCRHDDIKSVSYTHLDVYKRQVDDMKILDNITNTVRADLRVEIKRGSKISVAAACFSMYAYQELKKQLESVEEFRFIFTSPTFVKKKAEKQKREFYIPRLSREISLYGTELSLIHI